ncbi:MAG: hypothetical protein UT93_C0026G0001 [Candidatus Woesebacteria bacterium GW2011_GWF1_40_24]|uniref:Uncharacterized protein n=1 Tax=Candidatus Woesebacteria bacterium GW2011_GWF1_40_24 TaxID=1618601 RepID=A0A0G0RZ10_9BACT|nr:MAG: hypothetical protein UT93_C0026G0001 [Candidatus Woesebacteria bacterium GW2011_GWF1_40_24]
MVEKDALVRLPLFDFPGMEVRVDGEKVAHINNDCRGQEFCLGLITFTVPAGQHLIEAELTDTPIRKIGNYLSLISIGVIIWLIIKKDAKKTK